MREILFRGKRCDNGKWVEGYYFKRKDTMGNIIESVIVLDAYEQITSGQRYMRSNLNCECFHVNPETVGQFTGLTDKNGKKIFEGDIVTARDEITFSAFEFGITGKVVYDECAFFIEPKDVMETQYLFNECAVYEVIGNIHDNPELLGGAER